MAEIYDPDTFEPWPTLSRRDDQGRAIIPAFSLHKTHDEHYVYWTVNLHDQIVGEGEQAAFELFHSRDDAERFIAAHKGKVQ